MIGKNWMALGPALLLGAGIILSTLLGKFSGLILAGPLLLVACMLVAGNMESRLRGKSSWPLWAVLIFGSTLALVTLITGAGPMKDFIPFIAAASWISLQTRHESQPKTCRNH